MSDNQKKYAVAGTAAASGGVIGGVSGAAVGGTTGLVAGGAVGLPLALFTFGLSVPISAAVGAGIGAAAGTGTGATIGAVTGGVAGAKGYDNREQIKSGATAIKNQVSDITSTTITTIRDPE